MVPERNRKIVQRAYEAFLRGEVGAVVDSVADGVVWTNHSFEENPSTGVYHGKRGVQQFFAHFDEYQLERFDVRSLIAVGDTVVVVIDYRTLVRSSGKAAEGALVHTMKLRDGKVAVWDSYEDVTAANPWV